MIVDALLLVLYGVVYVVSSPLRLLDDVTIDSAYGDSIASASAYISPLNSVLPVTELLIVFALFIYFELAYFTYKGIMWVVRKIPAIS